MKLAPHRATTRNLAGVYPLLASPALPPSVFVGANRETGSAFCWDPWELYRTGHLRGPNVLMLGEIGLGKSALVKSLVGRHRLFGRRAFIVSPKPGEYDALARSLGTEPIRLEPGGSVRVNPLTGEGALAIEQLSRLLAIAETVLGRPLTPKERSATRSVLDGARNAQEVTIPRLVAASRSEWGDGDDVRLALEELCDGELAGMFDGPTTKGIDLDAPVVVLDLGAVWNSTALSVAMVAAAGWMRAIVTARDQHQRFLVVDEAWRILGSVAGAELLQSSTKTSRSYGVSNVLVVHKLSDLETAGDKGSRISAIVQNLLADCETRVIFRQPSDQLEATASLLQLTDTEIGWVRSLERGEALWKVGAKYSAVVRHRLSDMEKAIVDTDARMRGDR